MDSIINMFDEKVAEYRQEKLEKEMLFNKAMKGDFDMQTKHVEDLDLIIKHIRLKEEC